MENSIVVPADIFDALEFSSLRYGGIGGGSSRGSMGIPLCIIGHGFETEVLTPDRLAPQIAPKLFDFMDNDYAVAQVNKRVGHSTTERISWEEYIAERNIVRGNNA